MQKLGEVYLLVDYNQHMNNGEEIKLNLQLQPSLKLIVKPYLVVKLAQQLSLKEEEIVKLYSKIEQSEEFQKLVQLKIISRKPFIPYFSVKEENYEYREELFSAVGDTSYIYEIVNQHPEIIKLIKKVGEENYRKYFLSYETYTFEEIAKNLGLKLEEVKQIFDFTNGILIYSDIENKSSDAIKLPESKYVKVAKIGFVKNQPVIEYRVASMFRGFYDINYERLKEFIKNLLPQERKKIKEIVRELEILNIRKSTLHRIIETIAIVQKEFLITGLPEKRKVLTQKEISQIVGVDPSVVCRIVKDKTILGPSNKEYKLVYLLPNRKEIIMFLLQQILENQKKKRLTDKELCKVIANITGFTLSRRTINYYRNLLRSN